MDLGEWVSETWDERTDWQDLFARADYLPVAPWCDEAGLPSLHLNSLIDELAEELSNLRMGATALRDLIDSYLRIICALDSEEADTAASVMYAYLRHPPSCHPAFSDDPAKFLAGLKMALGQGTLNSRLIDVVMAAAPDLFADLAHAVRSSYVYIPDDAQDRERAELSKMTGHFGELVLIPR